ncbi:Serine/arginine-rich SC35-like splicing factor SCL30A, partial [Linum perenne]
LLCRIEDLRRLFGQFGLLKDIYLPRDLNTGELRGFAFIEFANPSDAADARYNLEGETLRGRELTILFAVEDRKKSSEMRTRDHVRPRSPPRDRRSRFSRSPAYSPSSRGRRYSRYAVTFRVPLLSSLWPCFA